MNNSSTISGKIDDLITRFFYQDDQLCFRIMIKMKGGLLLPYNEYDNYDDYRNAYADLLEKKLIDQAQQEQKNYMKIA